MQEQVTEIQTDPFYEPVHYNHPDGGDDYWVSRYGVRIGRMVIHVCNGSLVASYWDLVPDATHFDLYIMDRLLVGTGGKATLCEFNTTKLVYEPVLPKGRNPKPTIG